MQKNHCFYPERKTVRVIIDSDAACECDDNYAILHALMSRKADVRGVIAEQFGAPTGHTMQQSRREIEKLICNDFCQEVNLHKNHHKILFNYY